MTTTDQATCPIVYPFGTLSDAACPTCREPVHQHHGAERDQLAAAALEPLLPNPTPVHQRPTSCHVCGTAPRLGATRPDCSHDLTNAEAFAAADEHDRQVRLARTPEAAYVDQHRPY